MSIGSSNVNTSYFIRSSIMAFTNYLNSRCYDGDCVIRFVSGCKYLPSIYQATKRCIKPCKSHTVLLTAACFTRFVLSRTT